VDNPKKAKKENSNVNPLLDGREVIPIREGETEL